MSIIYFKKLLKRIKFYLTKVKKSFSLIIMKKIDLKIDNQNSVY